MLSAEFTPKFFSTIKGYKKADFMADLMSGTIVGIVALPLAIAFAIASGVAPEKGLITAIVAGFIISFLGGSRVQIGGPTGAFVVIVYGIVEKYGLEGLTIATIMSGVLLLGMGLAKLGTIIKFIPLPVIVGFTSGIAVIIFSSQVKDFLGLTISGNLPADFIEKWEVYFNNMASFNLYSIGISVATVLIIIYWPKITHKIPGSLIALIAATAAAAIFNLPVETIGSKFGTISANMPLPKTPAMSYEVIKNLIQPAFTIAMLGAIESLLSAVVADGMIGTKHRSNMELVAQGIANIVTPMFGGIPATGAIARTATNIKNGGRTPVAGMVHALVLFLILLLLGHWAKLIPLSCLAGILVVVAYNMSEWRSFISVVKGQRSDAIVLVLTFLLTVIVDLTLAIEVGMLMAVVLFMRRMSESTNVSMIMQGQSDEQEVAVKAEIKEHQKYDKKGVEIYEINGPFFFGVAHKFDDAVRSLESRPKVRVLRLHLVPFIDATGLHNLTQFCKKNIKEGIVVILSGVISSKGRQTMEESGLSEFLGRENILATLDDEKQRVEEVLAGISAGKTRKNK